MDIMTTKFELDISPFLKAIRTAVDAASKLLDLKPKVDSGGLQDLANQIQGIDTSIDVGVNIDSGSLDDISETVSNLDTTAFVNIQADTSSLDNAQEEVDKLTKNETGKIKLNTDDSEVKRSQEEVKELNQDIKDIPDNKKVKIDIDGDKATTVINNISGGFGKLGSFISGAVGGALASVATNAISNFGQAAEKADQLGDNLLLAFSQAGVGAELDNQVKLIDETTGKVGDLTARTKAQADEQEKVTAFASKLNAQFAISSDKTKEIFANVVSLSGQTGQAAEDTTKLALGIEAASGGIVSAEQAAKLLAKGIADPESQAQLDALTKKFPQLKDALSSTAPLADKAKAGLDALGNTFDTLESQAKGPDAAIAKIQDTLNVASQAIGGAFVDGLAPALNQLVPLIGELTTAIQPVLVQLGGQLAGALGKLATEVFPLLVSAITPIIKTLGQVLPPIIDVVVSALANLLPVIQQIFTTLGPIIGQLLGALAPVLGDILSVIAQLAGRIVQALLPIITKIFAVIIKLLPVLSPLIDALGDVLGPIIDTLGELLTALIEPLLPLIQVLVTALAPILTIVIRVLGILINAGLKVLTPLIKGLMAPLSFIGSLFNALAGFAQKVSGWFTKLINDNPILKRVFDAVKSAIQNLLGLLPDFIKEALGMQTANTKLAQSSKKAADAGAKQGSTTADTTKKINDNTDTTDKNTKSKGSNSKAIDKQVVALDNIKKSYEEEKKAIDEKKNAALIALDEQRLAEGRLTESIDDKLKKQAIERKSTEELSIAQEGLGKSLTGFASANKKLSVDATKSFQELSTTVVQAGNDVRKQFTAQGFGELQFRVDLDQKGLADTLAGIDKTISTTAKNFGKVFKDESELIASVINGTTDKFVKAGNEQIESLDSALKQLTGQERRLQAIVDIDVSEAGIAATRKRFADISTELSKTRVLIETETDPEKLAQLRLELKALEDQQVVLAIALDPEKRKVTEDGLESIKAKIEDTSQSVEDLDDKLNETLGKTRLTAIPLQVDVELPDLEHKQREIEIAFRTSVESANQVFEKEFADLEDLYDKGLLNDQQFFNATTALQRRRTDVTKKAGEERTKALREEVNVTNAFVDLFESIGKNIQNVLFPEIDGVPEGTKNAFDEQYKLLKTQLELQLITYEDYNKAVLELESKRNEDQGKLQDEAKKKQLDALKAITNDSLPKFNEAFTKSNAELAAIIDKGGASLEEIGNKSLEVLAATAGQALLLAIQNAESLNEIGKQFAKQLIGSLLNVLQAQLQAAILSAIFKSVSSTGAAGLLIGAAVGATLTALFAVAKAKITSALGFEQGGYTGSKGTSEVAGLVHGQEYVVNAKATKKNRKALEFINSSNGTFEQFINMQFGNRIVNIEKAVDGLQFKYNHEGIIKGIVDRSVKQNVFNNESIRNYNQTKVANYVDTSTMSSSINGLALTMDTRMASMERTIDGAIRQNATLTRSAQQLDVKVASDPGSSITWLRKQGKINSNR